MKKRPTAATVRRFDRSACPTGETNDPAIVLYHQQGRLVKVYLEGGSIL